MNIYQIKKIKIEIFSHTIVNTINNFYYFQNYANGSFSQKANSPQ